MSLFETMHQSAMPTPDGFTKALTVCQYYAEEIAQGLKRVENRNWATKYRGPLLIHAGKSRAWLDGETDDELAIRYGRRLEFGAIIARVSLVDCLRASEIEDGKHEGKYPGLISPNHKHHINGPWCFVLSNVERIDPAIPFKGAQGFWHFPNSLLASTPSAKGGE